MFRIFIIAIVLVTVSGDFTSKFLRFDHSLTRIVGGEDATKPVPYMVSISYYGSHHCGGAIINKRIILTAAHCLSQMNKRLTKVRVGSLYQRINDGILIPVQDWKAHEHFDSSTMDNDIGVIYLSEDIPMKAGEIESIPMADKNTEIPDGLTGLITGWGLLEMNGPEPAILQVAAVPIINYKECSKLMEGKITKRMICAGYMEGGIDACQMDSGGPLVVQKKLVGIVSWGDGCAKPERPGIYSKVSELREWIDEQIQKFEIVELFN